MSAIFAIARADAAERMRRFPFLVIIALSLYAGYIYIPEAHAAYQTIAINGHRGIYDSAYLGVAVTVLDVMFLSLFGFFFVRGSVERDRELHVDGAVAASPVSRATFICGKWLSNVLVLVAVTAVTYVAAIGMQEWHGESRALNLLDYAIPYVCITLPSMGCIAALAVLFDIVPFLRGILGGVVYVVVVWMALTITPIQLSHDLKVHTPVDPMGMTSILSQLREADVRTFPNDRDTTNVSIGGEPSPRGGFKTYRFAGLLLTPLLLLERLAWASVALALVLFASQFFDRFRRASVHRQRGESRINVAALIPSVPGLRVFRAEASLLVSGVSIWWLIGAGGLVLAQLLLPTAQLTDFVVPAALIWPLERISALGARERIFDTAPILAATPGYSWGTGLIQWLVATLLQAVLLGGFLVRLIAEGHVTAALALFVTLGAVAGIALLLGTFTGAVRAFQALYLVAWYLGPIQHLPELDVAKVAVAHSALTAATAGVLALGSVAGATALRAFKS